MDKRISVALVISGSAVFGAGFELKLYNDDAGYVFAIKDMRDTCRYAIFSDQSGLLYEKALHATPTLASD